MAKSPMRWSKAKRDSLLAATSYELKQDGQVLARAQRMSADAWFWYGMGQNTANRPLPSLEDVKAQVREFISGRAALQAGAQDGR